MRQTVEKKVKKKQLIGNRDEHTWETNRDVLV